MLEGVQEAGEGEFRGRPRKVAVIGVHGIARHPPGETANAMADLLLALPAAARGGANSAREYDPFREVDLRVPLQREVAHQEQRRESE